jgi:hypothetical protein
MFYCDPCADNFGWVKTIARSLGACEICCAGPVDCNDKPSSVLPDVPLEKVQAVMRARDERMIDEVSRKTAGDPDIDS